MLPDNTVTCLLFSTVTERTDITDIWKYELFFSFSKDRVSFAKKKSNIFLGIEHRSYKFCSARRKLAGMEMSYY